MRDKIIEILQSEFGVPTELTSELTDETDLLGSGLLDSFDFVQFLMIIDDIYDFSFDFSVTPPDSLTTIANLNSLKNKGKGKNFT